VTSGSAISLTERLRAAFPEASGRRRKQWLATGRVRVSGRVVREGRALVGPTDAVALGTPTLAPALPGGLRILHEDADLLVVEKPSGLLTIATHRERERTVYHVLWEALAARRPSGRPFIVHRLDRETSGLLVFARSAAVKRRLQEQFEARTVERLYVAVVEGRVRADAGTLAGLVVQDRALQVRAVPAARGGRAAAAGQEAITRYRVLERRLDATLLELSLGTGRRQQIRAQLADLGHPVVGDRRHGSARDPLRRLCLHAWRLGFLHPASGSPVRFESPPPAAFARVGKESAGVGRRRR
jgi:23S rRNA pseudouridine1911/1915/1917 synthase